MFKRILVCLLATVTMSMSLSACTKPGPLYRGPEYNEDEQEEYFDSFDESDYSNKGDVTVTVQLTGMGKDWMVEMAENYKKITGINVNIKESQDATAELNSRLSIGAGLSDLYFDWSSTSQMFNWANQGYLADLSDLVNQVADYRDPVLKTIGVYKDRTYTMPFAYNPAGFVYNQDYLDQINSYGEYTKGKWPETWQGLLDLCTATQNSNLRYGSVKVQPLVFGGTVGYMTYLFNGMWKSEDPDGYDAYWSYSDKSGFNGDLLKTEATVKVMKALRDLLDPKPTIDGGYYPANAVTGSTGINHTVSQTRFLNGAAVFCVSGAWFENEMRSNFDEDSSYHFGRVPVISSGKMPASYILASPSEHFTVPSAAKNSDGGKQFLKFLLQKQNIVRIVNSLQVPLAYEYNVNDVKFTEWGKEVHDALYGAEGAITYSDSDIMHCGALTVFGSDDPFIEMSTKGITAEAALDAEVAFRTKNFDYFLDFLPKN